MTKEQCKLFEKCEAPLCPLEDDSSQLWYPDEGICRARKFHRLPWIKKQKRIAKLGLTIDAGFFTAQMLKSIDRITRSLKGADPDEFDSETRWLEQREQKRVTASKKRRNNKASKEKTLATVAL